MCLTKIGDLGYDHWISDHVLVRINIPSGWLPQRKFEPRRLALDL